MNLLDVDESKLGVWVEGATLRNPTEQNLVIIYLAIKSGWEELTLDNWTEMYGTFIDSEPSYDELEQLSWILDDSVEWLNNQISNGYYFTFRDGDFVLTHEDLELG